MRTFLTLLAPLLIATATLPLERGEPLPPLSGELLTGAHVTVPTATRGKVTLLALGFTHGAAKAVEAWDERFGGAFGADTTVTWIGVPIFGGFARVMKPVITAGMRGGTPEADRTHVMTVWGGADAWKQRVGYERGEWAYLVLLDREGRVRWSGRGLFDEALWRELEAATRDVR